MPALAVDPIATTQPAAANVESETKPKSAVEQTIEKMKHPFKGFSWGADERIRQEYLNNHYTLNEKSPGHEFDFGRYRTRLWGSYSPAEFFELNARLNWEWRQWENTPPGKKPTDWSFVRADVLNFKLKTPKNSTALTVGRQDIALGDGWLVMDGTPLDGSTTLYFDAARLNTTLPDIKTTFDLIYIDQYARIDKWLPTMNDNDEYIQIEQDERAAMLYASNKSRKDTTIDGYLIYKHEKAVLPEGPHSGNSADIYTVGSRVERSFNEHWKGRIEGAYQFGNKNSQPLSAWGAVGRLTYLFNDPLKNQLFLAGEALSGRRKGADTDQQFDPLWGRWPQWSELYIYTYRPETRIAETTNLFRLGPGYQFMPTKNLTLSCAYNALWAMETPLANTSNGGMNFGDGHFRGHLLTSYAKYKFSNHLAGHLWGEYFIPGGYYASPSNDPAIYLRMEIVLTF